MHLLNDIENKTVKSFRKIEEFSLRKKIFLVLFFYIKMLRPHLKNYGEDFLICNRKAVGDSLRRIFLELGIFPQNIVDSNKLTNVIFIIFAKPAQMSPFIKTSKLQKILSSQIEKFVNLLPLT